MILVSRMFKYRYLDTCHIRNTQPRELFHVYSVAFKVAPFLYFNFDICASRENKNSKIMSIKLEMN